MSSEKEYLLTKISQIAGKINRHKNQTELGVNSVSSYHSHPYNSHSFASTRAVAATSRGHGGAIRARGRGGRVAPITHRNRTLVLNSASVPSNGATSQSFVAAASITEETSRPSLEAPEADKLAAPTGPGGQQWVAKRDRHMQLINSSVYDQQAAARAKAMETSRLEKLKRREQKQKLKLKRFFEGSRHASTSFTPGGPATTKDLITIGGFKYVVSAGGNKLIRIPDGSATKSITPKTAVVGGVIFVRSKNGNLWRSGLVKSKGIQKFRKISKNCRYFTMTGKCERGNTCPYTHDPDRVAICPRFLSTGECPDGELCDLSHDPTPHRVPACVHFLRGACSNPKCRYAHIKVNPTAPVCKPFATEGYCEKGEECIERHVHECPEFDRNGVCNDKKCKLPHIERASKKRMVAAAATAPGSSQSQRVLNADGDAEKIPAQSEDSDVSSDEDAEPIDSDDVDSDALSEEEDDYFIQCDRYNTGDLELAQQADFIHF